MRFTSQTLTALIWSASQSPWSSAFAGLAPKNPPRALLWRRRSSTTSAVVYQALGHVVVQQSPALYYRGGGRSNCALYSTTSSSTAAIATTSTHVGTTQPPVEIFRKDYQPLPFTVRTVDMNFHIMDRKTTVTTQFTLQVNPAAGTVGGESLVLDGDETIIKLLHITMDGNELTEGLDYTRSPGKLTLLKPNAGAVVQTIVEIVPEDNTQLSGMYASGTMYCTQCEAMGFRRITYYPDRPDNMAVFQRVRIEADKERYPILLSNGNLVEEGEAENGRHYAVWSDPFPKPSYLFATVAGNLGSIADAFTTMSGRKVKLQLFSEPENVDKLYYAMDSLKRSMKWDEDRYGLEYDLDLYNIVAVDSFNMGAMENKGLNVFNTAYVLADKKTATDVDFERVEGVIGHEYFHNWTGNRVTCRDWFQLTLKEGLTVFRDQEFSGEMNSKPVKRIEDVRSLRGRQFNEDAGPMSHPIRPESYISMDNFYTATVYVKGAEIIRMYQTLLTPEGFKKGMNLYFERHDGSAVTCDDFLAAMADANGKDLNQFALWYSTPGTPIVKYAYEFKDGTFSLTLSQENKGDKPLHIPISVGLLDKATGKEVVPTTVLELREYKQTFTFDALNGEVVPSILRDFSAPVKLLLETGDVDEDALAFLAAQDTDGFNRWEAGQKLYTSLVFQTMRGLQSEKTLEFVFDAFGRTLADRKTNDFSIQAYALMLPSEATLAEEMEIVDPIGIHVARGAVKIAIARKFCEELLTRYNELTKEMERDIEFKVDAESIGRRRLRNVLLEYLCSIRDSEDEQKSAAQLATNHFNRAKGMTDKMAALTALASMDGAGAADRDAAIKKFFEDANGDALVLNKWFTVQALSNLPDVLDRVEELTKHPDFTLLNPNRCRSLIGAFGMNPAAFHAEDGSGYQFLGEMLAELDKMNPQLSSGMAANLIQWRRYDAQRGALMKAELEKLAASKLSDDLYEIVSKGLK